jgi:hypothetical protein
VKCIGLRSNQVLLAVLCGFFASSNVVAASLLGSESSSGDFPNSSASPTFNITSGGSYQVTGSLGPTPNDNQDKFYVKISGAVYESSSGSAFSVTGCSKGSYNCTLTVLYSTDFATTASGWTFTVNTSTISNQPPSDISVSPEKANDFTPDSWGLGYFLTGHTLSATDPDSTLSQIRFSLVSDGSSDSGNCGSTGDKDNSLFFIDYFDENKIATYSGKSELDNGSYNICVQAKDQYGATFEKSLNIVIGSSDTLEPTISGVVIPDSSHKVGDTVTATITVSSDTDDYTSGSGGISGTIAGYSLGSLSKTSDTTYTASFTITDGGTDYATGTDIPVSLTLTDSSGNTSSTYNTPISQTSDAIYANLPDISLSSDVSTINEDGGSATLTATITGSLNNQWPEAITVGLAYSGTATATTDYTKSDSITISAGSTTGTATVTGVADTLYDATAAETVIVDINTVSAGNENGTQQQTISITDAESAPTVTLSVGSSSVSENAGTSTITAALSHATYEDVTVSLGYSGTATSGTDYATPSSSVTITAGNTSANATTGITGTDDSTEEGSETIIIDITGVSGGSAAESGTQQQTITLTDDDDQTAPFFDATPSLSSVSASGAQLSVNLNEEGTAYYVVVADGASAPTADQVKAGQDSTSSAATASGSITTSGTSGSTTISGLEDGTSYDVYVVAQDSVANLQTSPTQLNLTTIDTSPNVNSITVSGSPAANASSVDFVVTFGDDVSGISADDFTAKLDGNTDSGLSVTGVSATSGSSVTVTVSVTNVEGAVRLDLNSTNDIVDESSTNPAAFTTGSTHTADTIAPTVTSIVRKTPVDENTNADSLIWTVTFSESVSNIGTADFSVSGTTATVSSVSTASGSSVDVTVSGGDLADYNGAVALSIAAGNDLRDGGDNALSSPHQRAQPKAIPWIIPIRHLCR